MSFALLLLFSLLLPNELGQEHAGIHDFIIGRLLASSFDRVQFVEDLVDSTG